jgi:CheY-like chemotaxis protein
MMARGHQVLVVDDDPELCALVAGLLVAAGLVPVACTCPRVALDSVGPGARFDLLVTDLSMPLMSGIELAHHARGRMPGLRVVVMSGDHARLASCSAGADEVLRKPFVAADLLAAVGRALERTRDTP